MKTLDDLKFALRDFARERDWEQFHTPKNLAMALIVETAELVEHFQWLTPEQSLQLDAEKREAVRQELADNLIYLTRLADVLGIDLLEAAQAKIAINAAKYPADKARGNNKRAAELKR
ncbi:MAG: nucleotide pyrophosphohydrolase [Sulfuricella sp.]|nr:nucleotide pyrophosphohydrolase [Sulfuricella sp.]